MSRVCVLYLAGGNTSINILLSDRNLPRNCFVFVLHQSNKIEGCLEKLDVIFWLGKGHVLMSSDVVKIH